MPERPTRPRPVRALPSSAQPEVQIGLLEKAVVLGLLGLGLIVFWSLWTRKPGPKIGASPRPTATATARPTPVSPAPTPASTVGAADLNALRAHFRDDQPITAIREVTRMLESAQEIVLMDQALVELEQNMERIDRKVLYQAVDEYAKKAATPTQRTVARYMGALLSSKTFLYERYRLRQAISELETLSSDRQSPLAPLALNKKAMLQVSLAPNEAIASFSRQIREFPECALNGFASLMIGTCYRSLDQDERAQAQYQETLDKYKTAYGEGGLVLEPFVRHALADTMIKLGNRDGARKELARIIAAFKNYPYLSIIEETLQGLPSGKG